MVSPSKIFNTSNSGFNVGIISSKKDGLKTHGASKHKFSSSNLKNCRVLANTKFYLDIRNRTQLAKVESTLKSYGAKIEVFFRNDIKVVVTDRAEWFGNGQSPSTSISPLTTPSPSSNQDQRFFTPKSRASAMLEKISQQPSSPYSSTLELAQKWRIPVMPVPSLWKWIAKVEEAFLAKLNKDKKEKEFLGSKVVVCAIDSPFIKIESSVSPKTPEFFKLGTWPRLYLDGHLGQCPFRSPSPLSSSQPDVQPKEVNNHLSEVKDKVAVELIKYDTDFRIKDNFKTVEYDNEEAEQLGTSNKQEGNNFGLNRNRHLDCAIPHRRIFLSKMTRRPARNNAVSNDDVDNISNSRQNLSTLCNGHTGRTITRQSSQELLKVQCNGLTTSHRNSKLLSPSGSDVLPLPTSRRSTRRASASWCGSTRELSQLSPTDSEIENIRRSESSFEAHDPTLDSPGITLRPKGQLWLPIALIGTTAEENGNCIRKRYEYSTGNAKLSGDLLDSVHENVKEEIDGNQAMPRISKESDSSFNSNASSQNEYHIKRNNEKKDTYCIITRNTKIKNEETNGRSRENSVESDKSSQEQPRNRTEGQKRSLSVCDRTCPLVKRTRTMSTNSVHSVVRRKKLSPEEKLLQDNKEYFKMEVLNNKLRSSSSLLNGTQNRDNAETSGDNGKPEEKIDKIIIKKIKVRGRKRRRNRWTKGNEKKCKDVNYAAIIIETKKNNNLKINGVIKKKRQSELMKLCNEAESFMFGESSRQGSTTTNATESEAEESSKKKLSTSTLPSLLNEETSTDSNCENEVKRRRKRRSHAEAFIHDNLDYYKFETPGSRLRYQGSFLDVKSEDKDFIYTLKQKKKERLSTEQNRKNELLERLQICVDVKEEKTENHEKRGNNPAKPSEELEKILFSFESIPVTEPWYEVYKRQDEGMENYYPLLSDPGDQPFLLPYELPKPSYPKVPALSEYYRRKRKKLAHLFNHPRKSPRCHASTLAILSSLKRRKRRSGTNISMSSVLGESPPANGSGPEEKTETRHSESEKNSSEGDAILDFLLKEESEDEGGEESVWETDFGILMEPFSDTESKPKRKSSDSCRSVKSDEEESKTCVKTNNRSKKLAKTETQSDFETTGNEESKHFSLQSIKPESFFKDMVIETRKKSGLNLDITSILDNFKKCKSMDDPEVDFIMSELNCSFAVGGSERHFRRKRKKARKINKTGWDNRKSRRRTGNKMTEARETESEKVSTKPKRIKTKVKSLESGISSENIIVGSKRRVRCRDSVKRNSESEDGPMLRSRAEAAGRVADLRRASQDSESRSDSLDSGSRDYPPCVVRVKKMSETCLGPNVRLRCSNGRYTLHRRRLALSRKKKRVIDYAWTTKKR